MSKKIMKIMLLIIFTIAALALIFFSIDYHRAYQNKPPIFCILKSEANDGGTKIYIGCGYKVIDFNRMSGYNKVKIGKLSMQYEDFEDEIEKYEHKYGSSSISKDVNDNKVVYYSNIPVIIDYVTDDIEELYKRSSVVVIADYVDDENTELNSGSLPQTLSKFEIKKILKNESNKDLRSEVLAQRIGGTVSLKELIEVKGLEYCKSNVDEGITEENSENCVVKLYHDDFLNDKSIYEHKTRLLMLNFDENLGKFVVNQNSFGMLSYNEDDGTAFDFNTLKYVKYSFLQ